eukprot:6210686-Pleurochrysis_carterae.AAC.2
MARQSEHLFLRFGVFVVASLIDLHRVFAPSDTITVFSASSESGRVSAEMHLSRFRRRREQARASASGHLDSDQSVCRWLLPLRRACTQRPGVMRQPPCKLRSSVPRAGKSALCAGEVAVCLACIHVDIHASSAMSTCSRHASASCFHTTRDTKPERRRVSKRAVAHAPRKRTQVARSNKSRSSCPSTTSRLSNMLMRPGCLAR